MMIEHIPCLEAYVHETFLKKMDGLRETIELPVRSPDLTTLDLFL